MTAQGMTKLEAVLWDVDTCACMTGFDVSQIQDLEVPSHWKKYNWQKIMPRMRLSMARTLQKKLRTSPGKRVASIQAPIVYENRSQTYLVSPWQVLSFGSKKGRTCHQWLPGVRSDHQNADWILHFCCLEAQSTRKYHAKQKWRNYTGKY